MKKVAGILIVIGLLVTVLAVCAGKTSNPKSIDELCALIGEGIKSAPFYGTTDSNIEVEKEEDDGEIWCGLTFNSDSNKYYIAGIDAVPESLEWEAESGIITSIELYYSEEAFDYVEDWFDENINSFKNVKHGNVYGNWNTFFYTVGDKEVEVYISYSSCCLSISESNGIL